MGENKLKFAIFGNEYQANKSSFVNETLRCIQSFGGEITIDHKYFQFISSFLDHDLKNVSKFSDDDFTADIAISIGGDGTFLKSSSRIRKKNIPIAGVNTGRLGFLAAISPMQINSAINDIFNGNYTIDKRSLIKVKSINNNTLPPICALNDVAILKRDNASMISIRAIVDKEELMTYQADGLIISTPTGSTAYSLSNGGPVIACCSSVFCITPVAPHSLNARPVVIPETSNVELTARSRSENFLVAIDGSSFTIPNGTILQLNKAPQSINMIKLNDQKFFKTLREKMMWGHDNR